MIIRDLFETEQHLSGLKRPKTAARMNLLLRLWQPFYDQILTGNGDFNSSENHVGNPR